MTMDLYENDQEWEYLAQIYSKIEYNLMNMKSNNLVNMRSLRCCLASHGSWHVHPSSKVQLELFSLAYHRKKILLLAKEVAF